MIEIFSSKSLRLFGVSLGVISIVLISLSLLNLVFGIYSNFWPSVEGVLLERHFEKIDSPGIASRPGLVVSKTEMKYISLKYEYKAGGRAYTNDRYSYGFISRLARSPEEFQKVNFIKVYFSPALPAISVLSTGVDVATVLVEGFFGIFLIYLCRLSLIQAKEEKSVGKE